MTLDRDPAQTRSGVGATASNAEFRGARERPEADPRIPEPTATRYRSRIAAIGIDLPRRRLATADLIASCRHPIAVDLERATGIRERRVCAEGEDSYSMAIAAAADCLARSASEAQGVELLVCCSISRGKAGVGYVYDPPMSVAVARGIGADRAQCFDVANACAGMLTGLAIADDWIRRGAIRRALVVSGEYITFLGKTAARVVSSRSSLQMPSLTLGDAGAAVLLERAENGAQGIGACELQSFAAYSDLCIAKPADDEPGWAMHTDALKLHRVAIDASAPTIRRALERCGLGPDGIDCVIPHQTTDHAIRAGTERLLRAVGGVDFRGEVVSNLEGFGNTASTSHFLALHRCLVEGRLAAGQRVLLLGFASGVVVGAVVLTLDDELVERYARGH